MSLCRFQQDSKNFHRLWRKIFRFQRSGNCLCYSQ